MTYLEHVTAYYVSLVGRGVALSSCDISLLRQWEDAGVPAAVVCRALRREMSGSGRSRPSSRSMSIAACEKTISRLTRPDTGHKSTVEPEQQTSGLLLTRLEAVGKEAEEGPARAAYRTLYRFTRAFPARELSPDELERLDELAVSSLLTELPPMERSDRRAGARKRAGRLLGRGATQRARARLADTLLERDLCESYGLLLPSTLLLGGG